MDNRKSFNTAPDHSKGYGAIFAMFSLHYPESDMATQQRHRPADFIKHKHTVFELSNHRPFITVDMVDKRVNKPRVIPRLPWL
ncbi:hypothetical protein, partial [Vibrio neptunius]|uniref:hypothetical protein n=1 Tax=Vibrio neptunius TaxID=170651 RepID=UPI00196A1B06